MRFLLWSNSITGSLAGLTAVVLSAVPTISAAQTPERRTLAGNDVAVYNIAGIMRVEGGTGSEVTVEITRSGGDASRLQIQSGSIRGRETLRVVYPDRRIVYRQPDSDRWRGRTTIRVDDDGTFGDNHNDDGRSVDIVGSGDGLDAHADIRVVVPRGKRLALVQRLRANFAHVVDPHQCRSMGSLIGAQLRFGHALCGRGARRARDAGDSPQRAVESVDQVVDRGHTERLAEKKRAPEGARFTAKRSVRTSDAGPQRCCSDRSR